MHVFIYILYFVLGNSVGKELLGWGEKKEHVYEQCTWQQKQSFLALVSVWETEIPLAVLPPRVPVFRTRFHVASLQQHQRSLWFSARLGKFSEERCKHNTTSYLKPFPFLINFISCRKKKSDGQAQKCLSMQARNSFANVLTLVVFVFFFPPFLLVIVAYSYGQQWLWAKHAPAGTHELGARRYNYSMSGRHSTELGSCGTAGRHSTELGSW